MAEEAAPPEEEKLSEPDVAEGEAAGFKFSSFREFIKFAEYVGDSVQMEFAAPVNDMAGAVLVQKGLHFRQSMLKSLWQFFNAGNLNEKIVIADTKQLHNALRDRLCHTLFRCLESDRFHVAQALVDSSQINIKAVLANLVQRRELLPVFLRLDQLQDPLLPHLGEVALVAGGLAEQFCRAMGSGKATREVVRAAILSGLLHDLALADDDDFLMHDIEKIRESDHARKSADQVKSLLPVTGAEIAAIIEQHHREQNPYALARDMVLEPKEIAAEALALSEYIFVQLRSQYRKDEKMNSAELLFYELGRAFGQGKFHPQFKKIAARLWAQLFATLWYGYEIGLVESRCPHRPSAIAYPTPRCTQVMCHDGISSCENYDAHFPLQILQATRFPGKPGFFINPGSYAKCKLAAALPKDIGDGKIAAELIEQKNET